MQFKYKALLIITPLIFVLDQLTKYLIRSELKLGTILPVIPGYFDIVHFTNKGAAFGMLAGADSGLRNPFFYAVSVFAVVVIAVIFIKLKVHERLFAVIFSLILAGIAGNILDRIRFGEVTDFLSFHIRDKVFDAVIFGYQINWRLEWPAFNVADSAITISMILLVYSLFVKPTVPPNEVVQK